MKTTLAGLLIAISALVGSGVWIGRRSVSERDIRNRVIRELAACTLEKAHREECWLPCASDKDCLAKNGTTDH